MKSSFFQKKNKTTTLAIDMELNPVQLCDQEIEKAHTLYQTLGFQIEDLSIGEQARRKKFRVQIKALRDMVTNQLNLIANLRSRKARFLNRLNEERRRNMPQDDTEDESSSGESAYSESTDSESTSTVDSSE